MCRLFLTWAAVALVPTQSETLDYITFHQDSDSLPLPKVPHILLQHPLEAQKSGLDQQALLQFQGPEEEDQRMKK